MTRRNADICEMLDDTQCAIFRTLSILLLATTVIMHLLTSKTSLGP
jgi:hypothetical protein